MTSPPFLQLYVGDYLSDTLHLTTEQHGAYLLLLMTMWRAGGELPNDPAKLARIARVTPKRWPLVWAEIEGFFVVESGMLRNVRLSREYQKAVSISQERKNAGRKGAEAKLLKSKEAPQANAAARLKHSQISDIRLKKERPNGLSKETLPGFADFWSAYPHRGGARKGRAMAERRYADAIASGADSAEIVAGARRYCQDRQALSGYAKDPATWLNQRCWGDDVEPPEHIAAQKNPPARIFDLSKFTG